MKLKEKEFPVFRKYLNNQSYFRITSMESFEEIKKNPNGYTIHSFQAKILPDRNLIHDMVYNFDEHWVEIQAQEYLAVKSLLDAQ